MEENLDENKVEHRDVIKGVFNIELKIKCPCCESVQDLFKCFENDQNFQLSDLIMNRTDTTDLKIEVSCPDCGAPLILDEVSY